MKKTTPIILLSTIIYATLRYNVFKHVPWVDWPTYVLNKSFALTALLLLMTYALQHHRNPDKTDNSLLTSAWLFMLFHAGISLAILTPAYYPKYFDAGKLTSLAAWSMMLGVTAAACLHQVCRLCSLKDPAGLPLKIGVLAFLSGVHAMLLGYTGWFQPWTWPGNIIPITLISFLAGSAALIATLLPAGKK